MPLTSRSARSLAAVIAATALTAGAAGCGSSSSSSSSASTVSVTAAANTSAASSAGTNLSGVTLTFGDIGDNLQDILKFSGEENTPYHLKFANFLAAPPITAAMVSGDVDVTDMSLTAFSVALGAGVDLKAIGNLPESPSEFRIIAKQSSGITGPAGLKGKRVGVLEGNAGEGLLIAALKSVGLTLKDVKLVNVQPNTGLQAFKSGQIDAWAIWDPWATEAGIGSSPVRVVADAKGIWSNDGYFVATPSALQDAGKRAAIADLLTRWVKATAKIKAEPSAWAAYYAKATGLPLALAKPTLAGNEYQLQPIAQANPSNLATVASTLQSVGLVKPISPATLKAAVDPAVDSAITSANQSVGQ
jgi:sulfonate transport system substrate-binding protein